jgi:hypothetical protein
MELFYILRTGIMHSTRVECDIWFKVPETCASKIEGLSKVIIRTPLGFSEITLFFITVL